MPDTYRFTGKDGAERSFVGDRPPTPAEMAQIEQAEAPKAAPQTGVGLPAAAVAGAASLGARGATALAQSGTNGAKIGGAIANGLTTVAGVGHGLYTGEMNEIISAPIKGWAAGKGGYFLTQRAQSVAAPVGRLLGRMAPYASALSGVLGATDLAQIAEPNRHDVGAAGVAFGDQKPASMSQAEWEQYQKDYPPVLNRIWSALRGAR